MLQNKMNDSQIKPQNEIQSQNLPYFKMVKAFSGFESEELNLQGNIIVTGNMYDSFKVFDIITGKIIVSIDNYQEKSIYCISLNHNNFFGAGYDGYALIWDIKTRKCQKFYAQQSHMNFINCIEFAPYSKYVIINQLMIPRLWDIETGRKIQIYIGHHSLIKRIQFNSAGDKLITCSADRISSIWNVNTGDKIHNLQGHTGEVRCGQFDSSGDYCATGSDDQKCKIWDVRTGKCIQTLSGHTKGIINLSFNQSGSRIVTVSEDGSGRIYKIQTGELVSLLYGQYYKIQKAQYFQSKNVILAQRDDEKTIIYLENGESLQEFEKTSDYSLNQQEDILLTISMQGKFKIWKNIKK